MVIVLPMPSHLEWNDSADNPSIDPRNTSDNEQYSGKNSERKSILLEFEMIVESIGYEIPQKSSSALSFLF